MFSTRAFWAALWPPGEPVDDPLDHAAAEDGEGRFEGEIHPHGDEHGGPDLDEDQGEAHEHPDDDERPGHFPADDPLGQGRHQAGLGAERSLLPSSKAPMRRRRGK